MLRVRWRDHDGVRKLVLLRQRQLLRRWRPQLGLLSLLVRHGLRGLRREGYRLQWYPSPSIDERSVFGPNLLRDLRRDCDIKLLVINPKWGDDMYAYRVPVDVPRLCGTILSGGSLPPAGAPFATVNLL